MTSDGCLPETGLQGAAVSSKIRKSHHQFRQHSLFRNRTLSGSHHSLQASATAVIPQTRPCLLHSHPQNACSVSSHLYGDKTRDQTWVPPALPREVKDPPRLRSRNSRVSALLPSSKSHCTALQFMKLAQLQGCSCKGVSTMWFPDFCSQLSRHAGRWAGMWVGH